MVRLVDLARLHAPIRKDIDAAIARVLDSGRFVLGEEVAAFEREIALELRVAHAVAVSSGSDALLCMLWADGIGSGDEVITPALTFVSPAEAIVRAGATPVFVDVGDDLDIDPRAAREAVTPRTRGILAVDLFGRRAAFDALEGTVPLYEDAAQAIGAGGMGRGVRAAALSFFPTKNLGALGDGGLVATSDARFAEAVRELRVHGAREKYVHERVGWNMRLDALQAAVLRVKLPHLRSWNAKRARVAARYREGLSGIEGLELPRDAPNHVWHQFVVCTGRRDALHGALAERGIETEVYYPRALNLQPCFAHLEPRACPNAERATGRVLALPIHPMLDDGEIALVVDSVRGFFEK
jgi:dTDP-4-amino-4,6-dideoxygalactose transaminase